MWFFEWILTKFFVAPSTALATVSSPMEFAVTMYDFVQPFFHCKEFWCFITVAWVLSLFGMMFLLEKIQQLLSWLRSKWTPTASPTPTAPDPGRGTENPSSSAAGSAADNRRFFRKPCTGCGATHPDHAGSECPGADRSKMTWTYPKPKSRSKTRLVATGFAQTDMPQPSAPPLPRRRNYLMQFFRRNNDVPVNVDVQTAFLHGRASQPMQGGRNFNNEEMPNRMQGDFSYDPEIVKRWQKLYYVQHRVRMRRRSWGLKGQTLREVASLNW